jgi:UDP-glucuronate 4-epimerase
MALFLFTKAILNGEPFIVFINGDMQIDFTHISYIVEGLVRVIYKTPEPNGNWNLGQPVPASSIAPYRIYNIGKSAPIGLNQFTNQNS